jgi:paromamine 6'-oxidase/6'''-hydroxyneomycin C oxidase/2'-deamino-2'-hydroxyparomamine 6'-oxidase
LRSPDRRRGAPPLPGDLDACIVGTGAAAALTAAILARAGLRLLLVEEGDWLPPGAVEDQGLVEATPALIRDGDRWAARGHPWTTVNVGGGAVFYGAASFRYRDIDFSEPDGVSWPLGPELLRPWYDWVEAEIGVAREEEEPLLTAAAPPPLPPHALSQAGRVLHAGGRDLGLSPFATPLAINSLPYRGHPACDACSPCSGYACESGAKASPVLWIKEVLARDARLLVRHRAVRLVARAPGRVDELEILDKRTGRLSRVRSRVFVLAASAVQSAALLLRSASPAGGAIGDESGLLGRHLCFKMSEYVCGFHPEVDPAARLGPFTTVAFLDFYERCPQPAGGAARGGLIYEAMRGWAEPLPEPTNVRIEAIIGDTPNPDNRVRLAAEEIDEYGMPRLVLEYRPDRHDQERLEALCRQAEAILHAAGATHIQRMKSDSATGAYHLHGTCRFGTDPRRSVLDLNCRLHHWQNVYVADGAFMPSPGALNPTLTIQANAARVAHHLVARLGNGTA